ncbi:acetolactate synthase catalytic subunit [Ensifer sp. ENS07]|uniref:acetolactate synthase catalytic subunit n=1 Tax=Ensifer sp. ENS07 TaxID=2769274 RepID=UPI00177C7ED6|nr:acetolactate synthase catalytic subunit [Ensifer sp. ENS07]MBD9641708.1 acetolactate synthase catalytic subunit [Ensifer sp. ENS07]
MTINTKMVTVAERMALALQRHGVEHIFAQSLPSALILAAEAIGIRQIAYRQENMGGAMADGYARVSGKVAVVAAQNGPAATLLVPPLAEALKASVPLIALVQDVERRQTDKNAFQELDHIQLYQPCAKWVRRVTEADRIEDYLDQAFVASASGRPGPAVLLLPADLLREQGPERPAIRRSHLGHYPLDRGRPCDDVIALAAKLIAEAQAPIAIAGGGVHASDASQALATLQEAAGLPVFTTNMGKGSVDEHHPLSAGVLGSLVGPRSLGRHTLPLVDGADLILLVGSRTNQNGTDSWRQFPPNAKIIHIDVDPLEIGRNYEALRLVGDVRATLMALTNALKDRDLSRRRAGRTRIEKQIAQCWARFEVDRQDVASSNKMPIRPERVLRELQAQLDENVIVAADASYSSMWVVGQLRCASAGARFITPRGLAGLGWGVPLAIGAKCAQPAKKVVAIVGDGGFAHSWAELETIVRSDLPIVIVVLNNGILGFQKDAEIAKFGRHTTAIDFSSVDHSLIARACGCASERVEKPEDLAGALGRALSSETATLIEVIADPGAHPALSLFAQMDECA